jgi:hypothetical protein
MWHSGVNVTTPEQGNLDQDDDRLVHDQGRAGALGEPALRAALLALGLGLIWAVLSRGRRRRPTDLW